jgi:hypothetical protein
MVMMGNTYRRRSEPPIVRLRRPSLGDSVMASLFIVSRQSRARLNVVGAPQSMKMGSTALSPCPYDVVAHHTTQ